MTNDEMKNFIFCSLTNYDYAEDYNITIREQNELMSRYTEQGKHKDWHKILEAIEDENARSKYIEIFDHLDDERN